jgi:hypothetical protein
LLIPGDFWARILPGGAPAALALPVRAAVLLGFDVFTAWTQTIAWIVIFFFPSARQAPPTWRQAKFFLSK